MRRLGGRAVGLVQRLLPGQPGRLQHRDQWGRIFLSVIVGCRQHENRRLQKLTVTAEPLRMQRGRANAPSASLSCWLSISRTIPYRRGQINVCITSVSLTAGICSAGILHTKYSSWDSHNRAVPTRSLARSFAHPRIASGNIGSPAPRC